MAESVSNWARNKETAHRREFGEFRVSAPAGSSLPSHRVFGTRALEINSQRLYNMRARNSRTDKQKNTKNRHTRSPATVVPEP